MQFPYHVSWFCYVGNCMHYHCLILKRVWNRIWNKISFSFERQVLSVVFVLSVDASQLWQCFLDLYLFTYFHLFFKVNATCVELTWSTLLMMDTTVAAPLFHIDMVDVHVEFLYLRRCVPPKLTLSYLCLIDCCVQYFPSKVKIN